MVSDKSNTRPRIFIILKHCMHVLVNFIYTIIYINDISTKHSILDLDSTKNSHTLLKKTPSHKRLWYGYL